MQSQWRGKNNPTLLPFYGDIDKPNIKTSGPVMVVTWVSKYCPDDDVSDATPPADGAQNPIQRAIRYLELEERVIPFSCAWTAYSLDSGKNWSAAKQLSNGERDAKQDSSAGGFNTETRKGQIAISWQEDPQGLQLGEADGPGDGGSGAKVNGGTDVWYTYANVDLNAADAADRFKWAAAGGESGAFGYRITDNVTGTGIEGQLNPIFDANGDNVDPNLLQKGRAGASRPNIGMVSGKTIIAYEETKGSEGLAEGKFVRYHTFPFSQPPATADAKAGCIISNPLKNARRVRFLTQSAADAGADGIHVAVFWKEGIYDKGGPSDIVVRRAMGDITAAKMQPAVDAGCATSDFDAAMLLRNEQAENVSSRASTVTAADNGLTDDTERVYAENALAHRGVLRGPDLWIGFNYTADRVKMWAQLDNYNFWVRKYTRGSGWSLPRNVTNITDKRINVREPRFFGTPNSNTNAGFCDNADPALATKPEFCQDRNAVLLAWGTQENVSPYDPDGGDDLGIYITASRDGGETFAEAVRYSTAKGSLFDDDESAFEAQIVTRPDGKQFYGVWNQFNAVTNATAAEYASGDVKIVADPVVVPPISGGSGGGCTIATGDAPLDPTLPLLAALGLGGLALRRMSARRG